MQRVSRLSAAAFLVVGGLVHLQLWRSGYRAIPYIGTLFVANVAASAVLALMVLVRDDVRIHLAGMVFAASSLVALLASRTVGLLGFTERAWTDDAVRAATAEVGAVVALAAVVAAGHRRRLELTPVPVPVPRRRAGR